MTPTLTLALSLHGAVTQALAHDPAVLQARAERDAASAGALAARAGSAPQLFVSYALTPQAGTTGTIAQRTTVVGLSKAFAFPGQAAAQTSAARSTQGAADARLERARHEATLRVVVMYLDAVVADDEASIAATQTAGAKRLLDAANLRLRAGDGPRIDVEQAAAAYASAQAAQAGADGKTQTAFATLDLALGLEPSARPTLEQPPTLTFATPAEQAAVNAALGARGDLRAADDDVRAAQASLRAATLAYAPSLDAAAGRQSGIDSGALVAGATISLNLHVPIDSGGAVRAQTAAARAGVERALAAREAVRRDVVLEVESALAGTRSAQIRVEAEQRAVAAAQAAAGAASLGFAHGAISAFQVLSAQAQEAAARGALISAQADAVKARYALRLAQGVDPDVTP
ncbi:TolC family protein [bacterium]|nr:MAG: TolC family protein [bacterium]